MTYFNQHLTAPEGRGGLRASLALVGRVTTGKSGVPRCHRGQMSEPALKSHISLVIKRAWCEGVRLTPAPGGDGCEASYRREFSLSTSRVGSQTAKQAAESFPFFLEQGRCFNPAPVFQEAAPALCFIQSDVRAAETHGSCAFTRDSVKCHEAIGADVRS